MNIVRMVVFDMAGTTIKDQNEVLECFTQAATACGLKAEPTKVNSMMGLPKRKVFEVLWAEQIGENEPVYSEKVETSYNKFKNILEDYYRSHPIYPTSGCLETFNWLKQHGIKVALNTGFYREVTDIILTNLGWNRGLNSEYIGSDSSLIQASITPSEIYGNEGRPAPYMIQKAMYKLGVIDSQSVICIGDTPSDLAAGKNANCFLSIGITTGSHSEAELKQYPHDRLIASLTELPDIITAVNQNHE